MAHGLNTLPTKLPTALWNTCAVTVDTDIYLFGGACADGNLSSILKFDTTTKTLTSLVTTLPSATSGLIGEYYNGKIYLLNSSFSWVFDIESGTFTDNSNDLKPSLYYASGRGVISDGMVYCVDSYQDLYRITNGIRSKVATCSDGESNYACGELVKADVIYMLGGYIKDGSYYWCNRSVYNYTTEKAIGTISYPIYARSAVVGDKIYIFSGATGYVTSAKENQKITGWSPSIQVFDTATQTISKSNAYLPSCMSDFWSLAVVGEKIYLFGGRERSANDDTVYGDLNTILEFDTNAQTIVTYNGSTIANIGGEQKATLACAGKKAVADIVVQFDVAGRITYDEKTTEVNYGQTATLACAGKKMKTNVVIDCTS